MTEHNHIEPDQPEPTTPRARCRYAIVSKPYRPTWSAYSLADMSMPCDTFLLPLDEAFHARWFEICQSIAYATAMMANESNPDISIFHSNFSTTGPLVIVTAAAARLNREIQAKVDEWLATYQ